MRHLANIVLGLIGMIYFYGFQAYHILLMGAIAWLIMALAPRSWSHKLVCVFCFAHLSCSHLYSILYRYGAYDIDVSTNTMLLTLRLQALAFSYYDGTKLDEKETSEGKVALTER